MDVAVLYGLSLRTKWTEMASEAQGLEWLKGLDG